MVSRAIVRHLAPPRRGGVSIPAIHVAGSHQAASCRTRPLCQETRPRAARLALLRERRLCSSKYLVQRPASGIPVSDLRLERNGSQTNTGLDLTIPGAAQSVPIGPLCLLSGLAAQAHVGLARKTRSTGELSANSRRRSPESGNALQAPRASSGACGNIALRRV